MNVEKLTQYYSKLKVRNKRSIVTVVPYGDGVNSVTLQPGQTANISTKGMTQLPNAREVHLVEPTRSELIELGVISPTEEG